MNLGRLIGYDSRARFIGTVGPAGFTLPGALPADRFEGPLVFGTSSREMSSTEFLAFPRGVYAVDFRHREVKQLFSASPGETVLWATRLWNNDRQESLAFVATTARLQLLDESGRQVFSTPLEYDVRQYSDVRLRVLDSPRRYLVSYGPGLQLGIVARQSLETRFVEFGADGKEISRQSAIAWHLPPVSPWQPFCGIVTSPAELAFLLGVTRQELFRSAAGPGVELNPLSALVYAKEIRFLPDPQNLQFGFENKTILAFCTLIVLSAIACSLACYFLAHRSALSSGRPVAWCALGLLLGPTGLMLMLAIREWPARTVCDTCGNWRIVTRDACEHCGAAHTLPPRDGTDILESALV